MKITDMLRFAGERGEPVFSFEFFPPKTDAGVEALFETVRQLHPLAPAFVSVTWGAGGSTRGRTLEMVTRIKRELEIEAMAHVTCAGATRDELKTAIESVMAEGIDNVLALRGDPPRGQPSFVPVEGGFRYSNELVQLVREVSEAKGRPLCIGGGCYPPGAVATPDLQTDPRHRKRKGDAGAPVLITQLFFDNPCYFYFVGRPPAAGLAGP